MSIGDHSHGHEPIETLPFHEAPCDCVKFHKPMPMLVELHHVFPQAEQKKLLGAVLDERTVPLCSTSHDNVHMILNAILRGEHYGSLGTYTQRHYAKLGADRIKYARTHHAVMPEEPHG